MAVKVPRVNDEPDGERFHFKLVKPYQKRSQTVEELFPKLFTEGLARRDTDAAKRFQKVKSGVHLIWQLLLKQEKKWLRFCGAEKCASVPRLVSTRARQKYFPHLLARLRRLE